MSYHKEQKHLFCIKSIFSIKADKCVTPVDANTKDYDNKHCKRKKRGEKLSISFTLHSHNTLKVYSKRIYTCS